MSLINEKTPLTAVPSLDFFATTPVQDTYESTFFEVIRPIAQLNSGPHIEFQINNAANEYIRLKETTLSVKFRIKLNRTDNQTVTDTDWTKVSIVNNFLHSLWSQIDLSIGESQTCVSLQTYGYRAYFDTILGSTEQARKTYLQLVGFVEDDFANKNKPSDKLVAYVKPNSSETDKSQGRIAKFIGKLHLDLTEQHRDLIGGCKLKLKLIQNRPEFYFMTSDEKIIPSIHFEDVQLKILKSKVKDEILQAHNVALNVGLIKYIVNRKEVRTFTIGAGVTSQNMENVLIGQMPRRCYVAFVDNDARTGSFKKDPYYFGNYSVASIVCFINGTPFPKDAYKPNFSEELYSNELIEFYRVSEQFDNDVRSLVTFKNYKNGCTIFGFNLSPDYSQGYNSCGYVNVPTEGVMRFEVQFKDALSAPVDALIFCEFDNLLSLGPERNAIMDYR